MPLRLALVALCFAASVAQEQPELVVLATDWTVEPHLGRIIKWDVHTNYVYAIHPINVKLPFAIDYDKDNSYMYWTDVGNKHIRRARIWGQQDEQLTVLNSTAEPKGIAVDASVGKVFFTDEGNGLVGCLDLADKSVKTIATTDVSKPRGIALDRVNKKVYWVDWGNDSKIEVCGYDGENRSTIRSIEHGLVFPTGLALDASGKRLFWTDAVGVVETVGINGMHHYRLLTMPGVEFNDITHFNGYLFMTEMNNDRMLALRALGGRSITVTSGAFTRLLGIHLFSPNTVGTNCPPGQFGGSICYPCGHCAGTNLCESTVGLCPCEDGYQPNDCRRECFNGTYGHYCQYPCGNCRGSASCHHVTGYCLHGCQAGWKGRYCNETCLPHSYGEDCLETCGYCADSVPCHRVVGVCPNGCQAGWRGPMCVTPCQYNTYGTSCKGCGHCKDTTCNNATGVCPLGCKEGWTGLKCDEEPAPTQIQYQVSREIPAVSIVGTVVAFAVVIVIAIIIIVIILRRKRRPRTDETAVSFANLQARSEPSTGVSNPAYDNIQPTIAPPNYTPQAEHPPAYQTDNPYDNPLPQDGTPRAVVHTDDNWQPPVKL